jgi:hypothetical protein
MQSLELIFRLIKKSFIHIRDEGMSPRYHPDSSPAARSLIFSLTWNSDRQTLSFRANGRTRGGLLYSFAAFTIQVSLTSNRRVRSLQAFPFDAAEGLPPGLRPFPFSLTG